MKQLTAEEVKKMSHANAALVLRGCDGDTNEWIEGINGLLTERGILRNGSQFTSVDSFDNNGRTDLLFLLESVDVDIGKLAMWRLETYSDFGGSWLSDYVGIELDYWPKEDTETQQETTDKPAKPKCPLVNADGNIYSLIGLASRTLKRNDQRDAAEEMTERVYNSDSYSQALSIIMEYVECCDEQDLDEDEEIQSMDEQEM